MPKYYPLFFSLIVSIFYLLSSASATRPSSLVVSAFPPWPHPGAPPFRPAANSVPVAVMSDQQPKKRRKRNTPNLGRKLRNKHSRPSLPSAPTDAVANNPALADNDPSPPDDDLPSPILIAPSKPSKDQIINDLKNQKKSASPSKVEGIGRTSKIFR